MSLGGKTTSTNTIDPDLKAAALANLQTAQKVGQLGFVPYQGATVAGLQPGQISAIQNTNAGLSAFGLSPSAVPTGGDMSPYAIYQQQLAQMAPGQRAFIDSMFINPMTGQMAGTQPAASAAVTPVKTPAPVVTAPAARLDYGRAGEGRTTASVGSGGRSTTSMATPMSYAPGGMNTNNPGSLANRVAAAATSKAKTGSLAPTTSKSPVSRSTATSKGSSGGSSGKGSSSSGGKSSGGRTESRR